MSAAPQLVSSSDQTAYPKALQKKALYGGILIAVGTICLIGLILGYLLTSPGGHSLISPNNWLYQYGGIIFVLAILFPVPPIFSLGIVNITSYITGKRSYDHVLTASRENKPIKPKHLEKFLELEMGDDNYSNLPTHFHALNADRQISLSSTMDSKNKLIKMVRQLPVGLKKLGVSTGGETLYVDTDFPKRIANVKALAEQLKRFQQIEELTIDLSRTAQLTPNLETHIKSLMHQASCDSNASFSSISDNLTDYVMEGGHSYPNNVAAALHAFQGVITFLKTLNHDATVKFKFASPEGKDRIITLYKRGSQITMTIS